MRGQSDGMLRDMNVGVGGAPADLLAASPRQLVFRVTEPAFGEVAVRFTDNARKETGMIRVIGVRSKPRRNSPHGERKRYDNGHRTWWHHRAGNAGIPESHYRRRSD